MEYKKLTRPQNEKIFLKFLVVGDDAVGKTAIVKRYICENFSSTYKITFGAEFSTKQVLWNDETVVNIQFWDIAGQERYGYITSVYYRNAVGCFIVFDISRYDSFESVTKWFETLKEKVLIETTEKIPVILLANKWDTGIYRVSDEEITRLCNKLGLTTWFKTSALNNLNIDEAVNRLIGSSLDVWHKINKDSRQDSIVLHEKKPRSSCCSK
ncbi:ras-related protein Rab-38-like [Cimex lectularius]|uniref:Ras-related protein Rab n=1 Tax=Cimex lectularius TaxID=79782 RepID=A0A8I6SN42_CIMLE|nr:ras-related protein Rab-38-like [Cimex lectularius]